MTEPSDAIITLSELRKAAKRAFGGGHDVSRAKLMHGGESLIVVHRCRPGLFGIAAYTSITIGHAIPQIARQRLLRILTVLGNRRMCRLNSGNIFCWSKP
jgi:hypothetical protein